MVALHRAGAVLALALWAAAAGLAAAQTNSSRGCGRVHTVQQGDTCFDLAASVGLSLPALQALNPGVNCVNLQLGQRLCTAPCSSIYIVAIGDSCWDIGNRFGLQIPQLESSNPGLNCSTIQPGQTLCVGTCSRAYSVAAGDFCSAIASRNSLSTEQFTAINPALNCDTIYPDQPICTSTCSRNRTVAPGESCWDIASANGLVVDQLLAINPGVNCSSISPGQALCVPSCTPLYTLASGDSCFSVAQAFGGNLTQLESLNPTLNCSLVYPGQSVCIAFPGLTQLPPPVSTAGPPGQAQPASDSSSSSNAVAVGVGVGVGVGGLVVLLVGGFLFYKRRKHRQEQDQALPSSAKPTPGEGGHDARPGNPPPTQQAGKAQVARDADHISVEVDSAQDKASVKDSAMSVQVNASRAATHMVDMAVSEATKTQIIGKLGDLSFIEWTQITGVGGSGTPMEYMCQGGYGHIYKGRWQDEVVVVKKMEANGGDLRRVQEELAREAYIMASCKHPNIAQIYGLSLEPGTGTPALVMRCYAKGSLRKVLDENPDLGLATRLRMARDIAWGMQYLHSRHHEMIVHGDLKTTNLLCDENLRVHISDFGLASMKTVTRTMVAASGGRTVVFSAPEILQDMGTASASRRSVEADVYAFGMVMFELFTGLCPFHGANEGQIVGVVLNGLRPTIPIMEIGAAGPVVAGRVPVPVAHLMERCWAQDPTFRPAFDQVVISLEAVAAALDLNMDERAHM